MPTYGHSLWNHWTVSVRVSVWVTPCILAVTTTVYVPDGVPLALLELLLPEPLPPVVVPPVLLPAQPHAIASNMVTATVAIQRAGRAPKRRLATNETSSTASSTATIMSNSLSVNSSGADGLEVEPGVLALVKVVVTTFTAKEAAAVELTVIELGLALHVVLGILEQSTLNVTVASPPPLCAACRLNVAVCPEVTVAEVAPPLAAPSDTVGPAAPVAVALVPSA